jgi:hypothetical protein
MTLHFITLAVSIIAFALHTESSLLGEPWQSVSQVFSLKAEELIQQGKKDSDIIDKYVKEWAKATGRDMGFYSLIWCRGDQGAKV